MTWLHFVLNEGDLLPVAASRFFAYPQYLCILPCVLHHINPGHATATIVQQMLPLHSHMSMTGFAYRRWQTPAAQAGCGALVS